jgi:predicted amidohydrolase
MNTNKTTARIASCSILPGKWEKQANFAKMCAFLRQAAAQGAELAITPEGCLEGYVVMEAINEKRGEEMLALAEPLDGPYISAFQDLARELRMAMLICFAERQGQEAYNCAAYIEADGRIAGAHRKTHLNEGYDPAWYFDRPGNTINAFDTALGRMGIMICYERRVPEVARCLLLDGAQIILNPSLGHYTTWNDAVVAARAHENTLPVVFTHSQRSVFFSDQGIPLAQGGADAITVAEVTLGKPDLRDNLLRRLRRPEVFQQVLRR